MSWESWWRDTVQTIGVALAFAFGGSAFLLWVSPQTDRAGTVKRAISVIIGGQIVTGAAIAFTHGYLGWSIFAAPFEGLIGGLIAVPLLFTVIKGGQRVEDRANDIADAGIKRVTGKEGPT